MSKTYSNLVSDLNARTRNQLNSVTNIRSLVNSSIRAELASFDYQSLIRHTPTLRAVYDDVYSYPLPTDMNDEALVDIHKYKDFSRASNKNYRKVSIRKFNSNLGSDTIAFDYSKGLRWLRANLSSETATKTLHKMDSLTANGTWTAADDGTGIVANTSNYISGDASISVTGNAGTDVSVVNSTMTAVDISGITKLLVWVYFPSTTTPTTITLLYGSDATNYYTTTATSPFNLSAFQQGWNLVGFDTGTATLVPDEDNIDYLKLTLTFAAANSETFLIDSILACTGDPVEIVYYSFYGWRSSAGVWMEDSTANEDLLNASANEYEVFISRCAYDVSKAIPMSSEDVERFKRDYLEVRRNYSFKYPTQRKKFKSFY